MITRGYGIQGGRVATQTVIAHIGDLNLEDADPIELEAGGILELADDSDSLDLDGGGTIELESGDDLEVGCE